MNARDIHVALVEDDDEIRDTLRTIIDGSPGFRCLLHYGNAEDAVRDLPQQSVDVVLMDIGLPGMSGIEGVRALKQKVPEQDVVMLTIQDDDDSVFNSICAGATGYLMKNTAPKRLLQSIEEVCRGGSPMTAGIARKIVQTFHASSPSPLTPREAEILRHLCNGDNYKTIAEQLFVSGNTVRAHIKNIYKKLHVNSRGEAVKVAMRKRLI